MKRAKQALVTGGCGFVGTNLIDYLLEKTDWKINVLDNLSVGKLEYLKQIENYDDNRIEFYKGDIRERKDIRSSMEGCDYVLHLAAQTGVIPSVESPLEDADINIIGTIKLLEEAVKQDVKRFTLASSAAPLGETGMPINEKKVPEPLSPYGASKLACEGYCSAYARTNGLTTIALRFSNVYGPNSWHKGSVVAKFIKQIIDGEIPVIYGDGEQTRDFIHTKDISQALFNSTQKDLPSDFELIQVATGEETSINDLYEVIKSKMSDMDFEIPEPQYGEKRPGEIYRNYADITKAKNILDYRPDIRLEEGLEETIDWFLENY
ncbi:MAG: GDP-mannose 4,6-dehydratase [Candidatus Saliniplasma sp.]